MTHKLTADGAAAVNTATKWIPIDGDTPRGVKLQLIARHISGVAQYGIYYPGTDFFTHWFPLPTFNENET